MCCANRATDATDLLAVRLAVAPYRENHDLGRGQPQRPGPNTEQTVSQVPAQPIKPAVICVNAGAISPFASKVFCQYGDHALQRPQHRSVDHHWPVQLPVGAEVDLNRITESVKIIGKLLAKSLGQLGHSKVGLFKRLSEEASRKHSLSRSTDKRS